MKNNDEMKAKKKIADELKKFNDMLEDFLDLQELDESEETEDKED